MFWGAIESLAVFIKVQASCFSPIQTNNWAEGGMVPIILALYDIMKMDHLHMSSQNSALTEVNKDLPLAESCTWHIHMWTLASYLTSAMVAYARGSYEVNRQNSALTEVNKDLSLAESVCTEYSHGRFHCLTSTMVTKVKMIKIVPA